MRPVAPQVPMHCTDGWMGGWMDMRSFVVVVVVVWSIQSVSQVGYLGSSTVLYYTVVYSTILYYTILYSRILLDMHFLFIYNTQYNTI